MPFATPPWLHNLAPTDKPIPAIRHTSLHLLAQTFWQTRHPSETREINAARAALTSYQSSRITTRVVTGSFMAPRRSASLAVTSFTPSTRT